MQARPTEELKEMRSNNDRWRDREREVDKKKKTNDFIMKPITLKIETIIDMWNCELAYILLCFINLHNFFIVTVLRLFTILMLCIFFFFRLYFIM